MNRCLIEINGVSKSFDRPAGGPLSVLSNIDLDVGGGGITSLVGPSGCGKSTLLQIIAGLKSPDDGEVRIDGDELDGPAFEAIYIFQDYTKSLFGWKTCLRNAEFGLWNRELRRTRSQRLSRSEVRKRAQRCLELVGLGGFEDHYPAQLSGGMQQRLAIARALVCEPDILLMDEPFSSVDALTRAALQDLLLGLWNELGLTIVFVTHDVDEAVYVAGRVLAMSRNPGRIIEDVLVPVPYPRTQIETRSSGAFTEVRGLVLEAVLGAARVDPPT